MQQVVVCLLGIIFLSGCAQPVRAPEHFYAAKHLIFPLMLKNARMSDGQIYAWPRHGYGYASAATVDDRSLGEVGWWHDWSPRCHEARQIPMVWGGNPGEVEQLWACNDYRPVLISNEPERPEQANMTPPQVADVVYQIAWGGWRGEILCCGTWADQLDYNDAVVASYESRYGSWPGTGWHVHAYTADKWVRDVQNVACVKASIEQVRRFVEHQRSAGRLGHGVVVSEYGVLSSRAWHSPMQLVPAFLAFEAGFRATSGVVAWAWYSTADPVFSSSDLLEANGRLTPLGAAWSAVARQR